MARPRVAETDEGIQGEFDVEVYDRFQRGMRSRGMLQTRQIIGAGVDAGLALEVGPGPGYLGLEWLKASEDTHLRGLEISSEMIGVAQRNAEEYGLTDRVEFVEGDALEMPFDAATFDGAFSNGSLHEWAEPERVLNEIARVLKPGGAYCVTDLRRDINPVIAWVMKLTVSFSARELRRGLVTSLNAAYTVDELEAMLAQTALSGAEVTADTFGLTISGRKA